MTIKIESEIKKEEILVRCLLHPIWAKKGKMHYNALLPANGGRDVSLLRLLYTNLHFCKQHAKSIKIENTKYWGLGAFQAKQIDNLNEKREEIGITAQLVCSPLDDEGNAIDKNEIYVDTPGLPIHSDLLYDYPVEKGQPSNPHRQYARELLKVSQYKEDTLPDLDEWTEGDFIFS